MHRRPLARPGAVPEPSVCATSSSAAVPTRVRPLLFTAGDSTTIRAGRVSDEAWGGPELTGVGTPSGHPRVIWRGRRKRLHGNNMQRLEGKSASPCGEEGG